MENNATYYQELISKYLAGEANTSEITLLFDWLKASPDNLAIFEKNKKIWTLIAASEIEDNIDVDMEWKSFQAKIEHKPIVKLIPKRVTKLKSSYNFIKIAAAIVAIAVVSIILYFNFSKTNMKQLAAVTERIESQLPDGTEVTLNPGSEINYPEKFGSHKRKVKFKGEAYFHVKHDEKKPFIITSQNVNIEVLGTSFYVNTKNDKGNVEVILTEGKVAVYYTDRPDETTILAPGDKVEIAVSHNEIIKTENKDINYIAWKTRKLIFENDPLSEIVTALNKTYNSSIKIKSSKVGNCRVTATFDNQSLDAVLNVLQATVGLSILKHGKSIELSGEGCN